MHANISNNPTSHGLRDAARRCFTLREGMSRKKQDDAVMQAVDGFMFAGGFGTPRVCFPECASHACMLRLTAVDMQ